MCSRSHYCACESWWCCRFILPSVGCSGNCCKRHAQTHLWKRDHALHTSLHYDYAFDRVGAFPFSLLAHDVQNKRLQRLHKHNLIQQCKIWVNDSKCHTNQTIVLIYSSKNKLYVKISCDLEKKNESTTIVKICQLILLWFLFLKEKEIWIKCE